MTIAWAIRDITSHRKTRKGKFITKAVKGQPLIVLKLRYDGMVLLSDGRKRFYTTKENIIWHNNKQA